MKNFNNAYDLIEMYSNLKKPNSNNNNNNKAKKQENLKKSA